MASCLAYGDLAESIEAHLVTIMSQTLEVCDPGTMLPFTDDEEDRIKFAAAIMEQCYVYDGNYRQVSDAEEEKGAVLKRRQEANQLLEFFKVPWNGRLVHVSPAGCCGELPAANRERSVLRAIELAQLIMSPSISLPAANKYTKVDPVIKKLCLVVNFFGLMRCMVGQRIDKKTWIKN